MNEQNFCTQKLILSINVASSLSIFLNAHVDTKTSKTNHFIRMSTAKQNEDVIKRTSSAFACQGYATPSVIENVN